MQRIPLGVLAFVVLTLFPAVVTAQDKLVIFGGYSYLRPPVTVREECAPCPLLPTPPPINVTSRQNLNGWEFSGTYRFLSVLGLTADFSGHYGASVGGSRSRTHQYNYLFGPEVSLPARVSPFAHILFGQSHQTISFGSLSGVPAHNAVSSADNSAFATAIGAGIDLKIVPHIWVRPIQIDYLATRLRSSTQNQPRVSAGLVIHF